MLFSVISALALLVAEEPAPQPESPGGGFMSMMLMALPILALAYFLLVRPVKQQEKQRQALLSAMKKNDKVVTSGGIIGIVAGIKEKEDEVTLKIDDNSNVRLRVTKSSIVRIVTAEEGAKEQKEGGA